MDKYGPILADYSTPVGIPAAWLNTQVGSYKVLDAHRPKGRRNAVWKIQSQRGYFIFKLHNRRSHWSTEVFAYRRWVGAFTPYSPELIALLDVPETYGMLLSYINASPLDTKTLPQTVAAKAYRQAGMLLRRLHNYEQGWAHGQPGVDGPVNNLGVVGGGKEPWAYPTETAASLNGFADRGEQLGCITPDQIAMLRDAAKIAANLRGEPAVPTHPDYTPGNWLVREDGTLAAIIDFENMAWGTRVAPLTRLILDYFPAAPDCAGAFYEGYGENLAQSRPDEIRIGCLIYAGYYAIAGHELQHAGNTQRANRAFERCAATKSASMV